MTEDPAATVVVTPRLRTVHGLFGGLLVVLVLAIVMALVRDGSPSSAALIVAAGLGVCVVGVAAMWIAVVRLGDELRVSTRSVSLASRRGAAISRDTGDRLVWALQGPTRGRHLTLTNTAGTPRLPLQFFDRGVVERACEAKGWRFGPPDDRQRIIDVLIEIEQRLADPDADLVRASFVDADQAVEEVRWHREAVEAGSPTNVGLTILFLPTGPLQEVSINSGWGTRFLELAGEVDAACANLSGLQRAERAARSESAP